MQRWYIRRKKCDRRQARWRGAGSVSICLTVCWLGDKLLLFHLKKIVTLKGLLEGSGTPPPDTFKTLLKSTKAKARLLSFSCLINYLLPLLSVHCSDVPMPRCCFVFLPSLSLLFEFIYFFPSGMFWDTSPAPLSTCCENISSGMFLDDPLLMGSCLANNKVLELSSASATP